MSAAFVMVYLLKAHRRLEPARGPDRSGVAAAYAHGAPLTSMSPPPAGPRDRPVPD